MLPVTRIVSRVQLCPLCVGGMGKEEVWCGGKLLTPSTNGNELVLHCATWPAANLIQLVGVGMRLNGIYLFNCRAPRGTKPFLLNHFTQIESQLALQLESHHSMCHEVGVGVFQPAAGIVWLFRKTGK